MAEMTIDEAEKLYGAQTTSKAPDISIDEAERLYGGKSAAIQTAPPDTQSFGSRLLSNLTLGMSNATQPGQSPESLPNQAAQAVVGEPGSHGETVGMVGGGLVGGPVGKMLGGAAGSALGAPTAGAALGGAVGEFAAAEAAGLVGAAGDYYVNPTNPSESLIDHLKGAAGRIAFASALGQTLGAATKGLAKTAFGEGKAATIPEVKARYESFKNLGITSVPPSAVLGEEGKGYAAGAQEMAMGGNYLGAPARRRMIKGVTVESQKAVQDQLEQTFPNIGNDYAALGVGLEASNRAMEAKGRAKVAEAFKQPALALAKTQGITAANVIFDELGSVTNVDLRGDTTNIQNAVQALQRLSGTDSGFNRAIKAVPPNVFIDPTAAVTAQLPPGLSQSALSQIFTQLGLDPEAQFLTYDQLKHQMTNGLRISQTATDPALRLAANHIGEAARKDLYNLMGNNTQAKLALDAAHKLYTNEFLDVFLQSPEAKIFNKLKNNQIDYSQLAERFISPSTSIEGLDRIEKLVGPLHAQIVYKAAVDKAITDSANPKTKMFAIPRFLTNINDYDEPVLQKMTGQDYPKWKELTTRLSDINTMYEASLNNSGTAGTLNTYNTMMGAFKLGVFGTLGFFTGTHIPPGPIVSAALGLTVPMGLARLWFSPRMLPYWIEGYKWSPTMKNASAIANRLATRIPAAMAVEAANQGSPQLQVEPPAQDQKSSGYQVQIEPR